MTDKYNYKSISLRNHTYKKLDLLSNKLVAGYTLSRAKTVEVLINHYIDKFAKNNEGSVRNGKEKEPQTI
tara:strand:+ start:409 stop:618 length:210 start_codon:yes stop_codon:yes gene_type:complete